MYTVTGNKIYIHCKRKEGQKVKPPRQKKTPHLCKRKLFELYVILVYPYTNLYTAVIGKGVKKEKGKTSGTDCYIDLQFLSNTIDDDL